MQKIYCFIVVGNCLFKLKIEIQDIYNKVVASKECALMFTIAQTSALYQAEYNEFDLLSCSSGGYEL